MIRDPGDCSVIKTEERTAEIKEFFREIILNLSRGERERGRDREVSELWHA